MARYELRKRIGSGGMAEIFQAVAIAGSGFEKPVAIKRILPHLSQDQRFIELLIAEAKILSELHHRNIVQIFDVGLGDDGQYFLVMEFVDGTDLRHVYGNLFNGRRLPVEVALHICSEICEALEHAHLAKDELGNSLGLVHRDVSPSNVLLSKSGEVKLTDFGIAKRMEEVTGHGGVRGKFAYISPEQAVNRHVDARSDVFSVGILLYELVCGQRLFSKMADFDALREVREGRVRPDARQIPGIDPKLAELVMRALQRDPSHRFQSAGEFGSALRGYRYSLDTEIADPSAEIAALVSRQGRVSSEEAQAGAFFDDAGGHTVVKIDTAAQFHESDLSGLHQIVASFSNTSSIAVDQRFDAAQLDENFEETKTQARVPFAEDEDEATRVSVPNPFLEAKTVSQGAPKALPPPTGAATSSKAPPLPAGGVALSDLARSSMGGGPKRNSPGDLSPMPEPKARRYAKAQAQAQSQSAQNPLPGLAATTPMPALPRAQTGAIHGAFPQPPAGPVLSPAQMEARRRQRVKWGSIAGGVALIGFLVIGSLLSDHSGDTSSDLDAGADAAQEMDAGVPSADAAPTKPQPPKGKRKKRRRKRKGKKK